MGEGIDGSRPTTIRSAKRALCIAEHEARKAGQRGDLESITNLRALVTFLAEETFLADIRPELIKKPE
jgi:hypothetical protein